MTRSCWTTYKAKRIYHARYDGFELDVEGVKAEVAAADAAIAESPEGSVLCLVDVRGTVGSLETVDVLKKSAVRTKRYIEKMAVIGVVGIRKILFDAVLHFSGQNMRAFNDLQAAQEWLVAD